MDKIKNFTLKSISVLTAFILCLSAVPISALSASVSDSNYEYSLLEGDTAEITNYVGTESEITIPFELDGYAVTSIGDDAFYSNSTITSVIIPNGVTNIGRRAFGNCQKLTNIELPDTLTNITTYAFYTCSSLSDITIPNSVTNIGLCAFVSCQSLAKVTILNAQCTIYDSSDTFANSAAIYGMFNSTAQTYAKTYSREFVTICTDFTENHAFDIQTTATCTLEGTKTYTCSSCGYTYDEAEAALGHTVVTNEAVDATCTESGLTSGSHCSVCDAVITKQETISALGHNYREEIIEPTCTEQGYTQYYCERCGDAYNGNYTDLIGHSFSEYNEYCLNDCGEANPNYFEDSAEEEYNSVTETSYKAYRIVPCYNQIKVAWNIDDELDGYEVYLSTSKNGEFKQVADVKAGDKNYFIINNLISGQIYYVKIMGYLIYDDKQIRIDESPIKAVLVK